MWPQIKKLLVLDLDVAFLFKKNVWPPLAFLLWRNHEDWVVAGSGGSRRKSNRGSTLQFWAWWVWWAWLAWKLDLFDDVVKQNPMISIIIK